MKKVLILIIVFLSVSIVWNVRQYTTIKFLHRTLEGKYVFLKAIADELKIHDQSNMHINSFESFQYWIYRKERLISELGEYEKVMNFNKVNIEDPLNIMDLFDGEYLAKVDARVHKFGDTEAESERMVDHLVDQMVTKVRLENLYAYFPDFVNYIPDKNHYVNLVKKWNVWKDAIYEDYTDDEE